MKNILIVCADKDLRKDLSKSLASKLKCLYLDIDELVDIEILNRQDVKLSEAQDFMHEIEFKSINRAMAFENCITTISHSMYVGNDNFKLFNNVYKIYVKLSKSYFIAKSSQVDKLEQELCLFEQIDKLITNNSDIVVEKEAKSISQLCVEIISNIK